MPCTLRNIEIIVRDEKPKSLLQKRQSKNRRLVTAKFSINKRKSLIARIKQRRFRKSKMIAAELPKKFLQRRTFRSAPRKQSVVKKEATIARGLISAK